MMRLLTRKLGGNSNDFSLVSFPADDVPPYAILSHTWSDGEEVTYDELLSGTGKNKRGYNKIRFCGERASQDGLQYFWVDTCCINKQDKEELTYALNAMFAWYRKSQICYCYMYDVPKHDLDPEHKDSKFRKSRWFTRGWALQELLAPLYLIFFNCAWEEIGTKSSLKGIVADITGIAPSILVLNKGGDVSVAQRLSWAAERQTSVAADKSYCLLGLLGVNIPMKLRTSNGKGIEEDEEDEEKTFFRFQVQMLKTSDDQSLFCWQEPPGEKRPSAGLLARSPRHFKNCNRFYQSHERRQASKRLTFSKKGLRIRLPLIPDPDRSPGEDDVYLAIMACHKKPDIDYYDEPPMAIYLKKLGDVDEGYPMYARIRTDTIKLDTEGVSFGDDDFQDICVQEEPHWINEAHAINADMDMSLTNVMYQDPCQFELSKWMTPEPEYLFCFRSRPRGIPILTWRQPDKQWTIPEHEDGELRLKFDGSGCCAVLLFRDGKGGMFYTIMGVHNYNIWSDLACDIDKVKPYETMEQIAHEYGNGRKMCARWENLDRRRLELPGGECAKLEIRIGNREGQKVYWIDIQGGDAFRLEAVGPGCCYDDPWKNYSSDQDVREQ